MSTEGPAGFQRRRRSVEATSPALRAGSATALRLELWGFPGEEGGHVVEVSLTSSFRRGGGDTLRTGGESRDEDPLNWVAVSTGKQGDRLSKAWGGEFRMARRKKAPAFEGRGLATRSLVRLRPGSLPRPEKRVESDPQGGR